MERLKAPTAEAKTDLDALVERQKLIRTVARERPDMLALIKLVNDCGEWVNLESPNPNDVINVRLKSVEVIAPGL